ncbi:uncharacterized protein TNCV_2089591 [Trichonephila clavipes]|nr:uncharacterized protein TNCV_2089591 [Trichonephila clavipes]
MRHKLWPFLLPHRVEDPESLLPPLCSPRTPDGVKNVKIWLRQEDVVLNPDCFCCICGEYVFAKYRKPISDFVKTAYHQYFFILYARNVWYVYDYGPVNAVMFETPMIWREPQNHHDDCYFCVVKINGNNPGNRNKWSYPNLSSAQRPQLKSREVQPSTSKSSNDPNPCDPERNTSSENS